VTPELAVVIPTRDRRPVLIETIERLVRMAKAAPVQVIVVDDGSRDGSADAVAAVKAPWPLTVLRQDGAGPAAARNRGTAAATAPVCLYIGDDSLPTPALLDAHVGFHRAHPDRADALLGLVTPAPPLDESPLQRWLHAQGTQFGYATLDPAKPVPPSCFWTSNVSAKTELVREVGGFDEGFLGAACEDAELGFRLARAGMRLHYDPHALALHFHPTDLDRVLDRQRTVGVAFRRLCELAPEATEPPAPGPRHRVKAGALTVAMLAGRPRAAREATWRFLCDQVLREAYWAEGEPPRTGPRAGRALARLARRDPDATPAQPAAPDPA
jgi:glycosyltransferase involved in cell wall biosynthesis